MIKISLHWRALIAALLLLPGLVMAQHYNNLHRFSANYTRSSNTCAIQLRGSKIVEGGTVRSANSIVSSVEIGVVDPSAGTLGVHPIFYSLPGHSHTAVDLIESLGDPGHVVCAANLNSVFAASTMVSVFKTDPSSGAVDWSLVYKASNGSQTAAAITRDNEKSHYVLGNARINNRAVMHMIKVKDDGTPIWERYYTAANFSETMRGIDLIFDGTSVVLVADYENTAVDPSGRGLIIAQVDPVNGVITNLRNLQHLDGSRELHARDIALVNGNYVIVGEVNPSPISPVLVPQRGFMVTYDPALNVTATRVYQDPNNTNMRVSGVRTDFLGNLYMSIDIATDERATWIPGLMQTNLAGKVVSTLIYKVKGYLGTNGLINVSNFFLPNTFMIKGSVNANSIPGAPSLSLIGDGPSIVVDPDICQDRYEIKNEEVKYEEIKIDVLIERVETVEKIELSAQKIDGRTYNCHGMGVGSFRLAAPAQEEVAEESNFSVFPNPSNGQFTITLDENQAATYNVAEIIDLMGKTVATFNINSTNIAVDLAGQTPGIYMLRMKSSDGHVSKTQRIMVR